MNKRELVGEVAAETGLPPADVARVVDAMIAVVRGSVVAGEKVVLSGFGTFQRRTRARRVARDIEAGRPLPLPATRIPSFRPGKPFREAVAATDARRRKAT